MPIVTTVLAIGTVIGPIIFGYVLWRMSKVFVSREQFDDFRKDREKHNESLDRRLGRIEDDIKELIAKG